MTVLGLDRLQFGLTTAFHFLYVPLSIGLSFFLALLETLYVWTRESRYREAIGLFSPIFLVLFVAGVVSGIVLEFQFGMNWSNFSRFVGDVFGAPLAVEALAAFFLESTFLGVWIFGWDRLPAQVHLLAIWLVAAGTSLSAYWILAANAFMQEPVGYRLVAGHVAMVNVWRLIANPQQLVEYPHTEAAALATGAFFAAGVAAALWRRGHPSRVVRPAFTLACAVAFVASMVVVVMGHAQAQHLMVAQPMKMAASEALWRTSPSPAPWTVVAILHPSAHRTTWSLSIPYLLSILAYNRPYGRVVGIEELQRRYAHLYGPHDYIPPVFWVFWSFRVMVLVGFVMLGLAAYGLWLARRGDLERHPRFLTAMVWAIGLPHLGNLSGWVMTEVGRQPWLVFGLERTADGASPSVGAAMVTTTLVAYGLVYGLVTALVAYLVVRQVRHPPKPQPLTPRLSHHPEPT